MRAAGREGAHDLLHWQQADDRHEDGQADVRRQHHNECPGEDVQRAVVKDGRDGGDDVVEHELPRFGGTEGELDEDRARRVRRLPCQCQDAPPQHVRPPPRHVQGVGPLALARRQHVVQGVLSLQCRVGAAAGAAAAATDTGDGREAVTEGDAAAADAAATAAVVVTTTTAAAAATAAARPRPRATAAAAACTAVMVPAAAATAATALVVGGQVTATPTAEAAVLRDGATGKAAV